MSLVLVDKMCARCALVVRGTEAGCALVVRGTEAGCALVVRGTEAGCALVVRGTEAGGVIRGVTKSAYLVEFESTGLHVGVGVGPAVLQAPAAEGTRAVAAREGEAALKVEEGLLAPGTLEGQHLR